MYNDASTFTFSRESSTAAGRMALLAALDAVFEAFYPLSGRWVSTVMAVSTVAGVAAVEVTR
jgi:hypothetical protein